MKNHPHTRKLTKRTMVIFFLGLMFVTAASLSTRNYIVGQTCFTTQTVSSDSRCLYILQGKVYEKGSRSKPHQGNSCGTDVTSIIPSFHFGDLPKYLDPNLVGSICTVQPSPTPTVPAPTATKTPTPSPTRTPTPTTFPGTITPTSITGCSTKALGDADCNGLYNLVDFEIWRKEMMHEVTTKNADFNNSSATDLIDFEIWRKSAFH